MDEKLWETLYEKILEGDILKVLSFVFEYVTQDDVLLNGSIKSICINCLLLAVLAGIFSAFTESFGSKEVSKMSCFMIYVLLFSILAKLFLDMQGVAENVLRSVIAVMNGAIPIYYIAIFSSGNGLTGYAYYRISILAIYIVEQLILHILLPFVSCYMIMSFGKAFWMEKRLSALTDFMKKIVEIVLKTMVTVVSGIGFLQSMVSPVVDGLKNETAQKAVAAIPGIGNLGEGMAELTIGSLVLIKNSVGVSIFMMLLVVALMPVLELFLVSILLKGCGALMAVIAEKELAGPVLDVSEAVGLLLKMVLAVLLLFVISMAIVMFTTT